MGLEKARKEHFYLMLNMKSSWNYHVVMMWDFLENSLCQMKVQVVKILHSFEDGHNCYLISCTATKKKKKKKGWLKLRKHQQKKK